MEKRLDVKNYPFEAPDLGKYYKTYAEAKKDIIKTGIRWLYRQPMKYIDEGAYWHIYVYKRGYRYGRYNKDVYTVIRGYRTFDPKTGKLDAVEFTGKEIKMSMTKEKAKKYLERK